MELETFQTIVTFLSLAISITSLVITLAVVWGHKETIVVQANKEDSMKLCSQNKAQLKQIGDINKRLFGE